MAAPIPPRYTPPTGLNRLKMGLGEAPMQMLGPAMALQGLLQKRQSSGFIPLFRDVALYNFTFMVDGAPKVMLLPVDLHEHLIEVPAPVTDPAHRLHPLPSDIGRKHWSEPVPPKPHGLVADVDPTLEKQVFDISQRQGKPHIHHHDQADDLGRRVEIAERAGWFSGARHALLLMVSRGERQPVPLL